MIVFLQTTTQPTALSVAIRPHVLARIHTGSIASEKLHVQQLSLLTNAAFLVMYTITTIYMLTKAAHDRVIGISVS